MTNFEYFKDDILEATKNNTGFGIRRDNGKIVSCTSINCVKCQFTGWGCYSQRMRWGYEEHVEKPKLTKKERMFCELVETGWIARDKRGELNLRNVKPIRCGNYWSGDSRVLCISLWPLDCEIFSFITWDDEEPWSVEDLLKLKYEHSEDSSSAKNEE